MAKVKVNSTEYTVEHGQRSVFVNDEEVRIDIYKIDTNTFHLLYNNKSISLHIKEYCREDDRIVFEIKGKLFECHLISSIEQTIISMSGEGIEPGVTPSAPRASR